jgi:Ca2+/H+ antiporter, TMEM165/GDT1 family
MSGPAVHSGNVVLVIAVFLAAAVEMVEALTIVLAVGSTRGWRSAVEGVVAALATLAVLVIAFGPALVRYVPLSTLRLVVGGLLLVFGLQWLRKAILRATGAKARHDEDAIFARQVEELSNPGLARSTSSGKTARDGRDPTAFVVAFKGVFLEGLEVVVIVITLGATSHELGLASVAAGAAVLVVGVVGLVVARQLSSVPENAMKMGVGLMLVSFGTFWSGEGVGVRWPGSDLAIPALVAFYGVVSWILVTAFRRDRIPKSVIAPEADDG